MLSATKHLTRRAEMLRCTQHDKAEVYRLMSIGRPIRLPSPDDLVMQFVGIDGLTPPLSVTYKSMHHPGTHENFLGKSALSNTSALLFSTRTSGKA
jgi:hypothetical protein